MLKKTIFLAAALILYCGTIVAQTPTTIVAGCTDFEDNTMHGWAGLVAGVEIRTVSWAGDTHGQYLYCTDQSGGSNIFTTSVASGLIGNWTNIMNTCCGAFKYDMKVIDDSWRKDMGGSEPIIHPYITFYGKWNGFVATAHFRAQGITFQGDLTAWQTIHVPINSCDPNGCYPTNADAGTIGWSLAWIDANNVSHPVASCAPASGGDPSAHDLWMAIFSNVEKVIIPCEWTGNPAEIVGYDNFCVSTTDCICTPLTLTAPPTGFPDTTHIINAGCCWTGKIINNVNPAASPVDQLILETVPPTVHFAPGATTGGSLNTTYGWNNPTGGNTGVLTYSGTTPIPHNQPLDWIAFCMDITTTFAPFDIKWTTKYNGQVVCTGVIAPLECQSPCENITITQTELPNCCRSFSFDNQWQPILIGKVRVRTSNPVKIESLAETSPLWAFPTISTPVNNLIGTYTGGLPFGSSDLFDMCFTGNTGSFYVYFDFMSMNGNTIFCKDSVLVDCRTFEDCCNSNFTKGCMTYANAQMDCYGAGTADMYLNAFTNKPVTRFAVTLLNLYGTIGSSPTPYIMSGRIDQAQGCPGVPVPTAPAPFSPPLQTPVLWGSSALGTNCGTSNGALWDVYGRSAPGTSQVVWGNYPPDVYPNGPTTIMDINSSGSGLPFFIHLAFNAPPSITKIHYCLQYQFTYENCCTCDTVKCDSIDVTKLRSIIFGTRANPCGSTAIAVPLYHGIAGEDGAEESSPAGGDTEIVMAADEGVRIEMTDKTHGNFYFRLPALSDSLNHYVATRLELETESGVQPLSMFNYSDGTYAQVSNKKAIARINLRETDAIMFGMVYDNPQSKYVFKNSIRVVLAALVPPYDTLSETGEIFARVPLPANSTKDSVVIDTKSKPLAVHTYAIYFVNANQTQEKISHIVLRPKNKAGILAVGASNDTSQVSLRTYFDRSSGAIFGYDDPCPDCEPQSMDIGRQMRPIYVTVSGAVGEGVTLDYSTINEVGDTVSVGVVSLTGPLTTDIRGDDGGIDLQAVPGDAYLAPCYPNPSAHAATLQFSLIKSMERVSLVITDMSGREVSRLIDNQHFNQGDHAVIYNTTSLPSGTYYYTLTAGQYQKTRSMKIVR